jgi:hypothetical protein
VSAVQARQAWLAGSQNGVAPAQSALATQLTQLPVATLHTGVAPVQRAALVAEHAAQAPPG